MQSNSLYRLTAACLITHELETILWFEWPALSQRSPAFDQLILLAHIPVVLGLLVIAEFTRRQSLRYGVCLFAVIHVALHWALRDQPVYDVSSIASWVLILLAGIFGAAYLMPQKAR